MNVIIGYLSKFKDTQGQFFGSRSYQGQTNITKSVHFHIPYVCQI